MQLTIIILKYKLKTTNDYIIYTKNEKLYIHFVYSLNKRKKIIDNE